ncbi:MAG: thioesterase family protein [Megasphaera sp.]|jgi:predicted thioesterase|uniref:thioesterase family protein n=1 Tax=Megasphaera sueciensis TaxID=349094 RepID=UPI003D0901C7|nr:thioesterase family protein [Megasphaera sp.]MCI1824122.1 thioesterase family protein [Megasphaera sp.]
MDFNLKPQSSGENKELVTENNTAIKYASGTAPVYATPALVGLMENAAVLAIGNQLPEGFGTVGISMNVKHVSATPIGMTVHAKATLTEQDRKKLTFQIEAYDEAGPVGNSIHERFIIETKPFLDKADRKKAEFCK